MSHIYTTNNEPTTAFETDFLDNLCQQNREPLGGILLYVDPPDYTIPDLSGLEATSELISPECDGLLQLEPDICNGAVLARLFENLAPVVAPDFMVARIRVGRLGPCKEVDGAHAYNFWIDAEPKHGAGLLKWDFRLKENEVVSRIGMGSPTGRW